MRRAQAEDWLEDLEEFIPADVRTACTEWRRTSTRRPLIADIRSLCIAAQLRRSEWQQTGWDREAYAREAGFASWAEREKAIDQRRESYALGENWRRATGATAARFQS
jgi:hypothetical protein